MSDYPRSSTKPVVGVLAQIADGLPLTSGASMRIKKDGGAWANGVGVLSYTEGYVWQYTPTATETDADHVVFRFNGPGCVDDAQQVYTTRKTDQARVNEGVFFDNEATPLTPDQKAGQLGNIDGESLISAMQWIAAACVGQNTGGPTDVFQGLDDATTRLSVVVTGNSRAITRS